VPNFMWAPTLVVDLGVLASGGVILRWHKALFPRNDLAASASTGGARFWHLAARDRVTLGDFYLGVLGDYLTRPDRPFYGRGNTSRVQDVTYYTQTRGTAYALAGWLPSNHVRVELSGGYRYEHMGPGQAPSIDTRFDVQNDVPGYGQRLDLLAANATLVLDSRRRRVQNSGVRWETHGSYALDPRNTDWQWLALETDLEAGLEVMHPGRVLSASVYAVDTIAMGQNPVPIPDQAVLGLYRLPGFLWGRYVDNSVVVFEVNYRYPIWEHLDALWTASAGNVFSLHFINFSPSALAGSLGVGVRTRFAGHDAIEVFMALGTSRFNEPFAIEGFRLHVGVNSGL
jgi:hypothetical protein